MSESSRRPLLVALALGLACLAALVAHRPRADLPGESRWSRAPTSRAPTSRAAPVGGAPVDGTPAVHLAPARTSRYAVERQGAASGGAIAAGHCTIEPQPVGPVSDLDRRRAAGHGAAVDAVQSRALPPGARYLTNEEVALLEEVALFESKLRSLQRADPHSLPSWHGVVVNPSDARGRVGIKWVAVETAAAGAAVEVSRDGETVGRLVVDVERLAFTTASRPPTETFVVSVGDRVRVLGVESK